MAVVLDPIKYAIPQPDIAASPYMAGLRGYEAGVGIQAGIDAREAAKQAAEQKALADLEKKQQAEIMRAELDALGSNKNATAADWAGAIARYPKESEALKRGWDILSPVQAQNQLNHVSKVHSALQSGNTDIAKSLLMEEAESKRNAGLTKEAKEAEDMVKIIDSDPATARRMVGALYGASPGADKASQAIKTVGEEERSQDKAPLEKKKLVAEIANFRSQIENRAGQLGLDRDKLEADILAKREEMAAKSKLLTDDARTLVNKTILNSSAATISAERSADLARRLRKFGGGQGALSKGSELFKKTFGSENQLSQIRMEYERLKNQKIIEGLPDGQTTDRDIMIFSRGFPESTSDVEFIAEFLEVMAKVSRLEAANQDITGQWVNAVGHLGNAREPINIKGYEIPAGSSYLDFSKKYMDTFAVQNKDGAKNEGGDPAASVRDKWDKKYK